MSKLRDVDVELRKKVQIAKCKLRILRIQHYEIETRNCEKKVAITFLIFFFIL